MVERRPQYVPLAMPVSQVPAKTKIIVFSQGMSPNAHPYIERATVLFTGTVQPMLRAENGTESIG